MYTVSIDVTLVLSDLVRSFLNRSYFLQYIPVDSICQSTVILFIFSLLISFPVSVLFSQAI
jgi:hypothetical protein